MAQDSSQGVKDGIHWTYNPVHEMTKHLEVDRHFIEEKIESAQICTPFIPTEKQLADITTNWFVSMYTDLFPIISSPH